MVRPMKSSEIERRRNAKTGIRVRNAKKKPGKFRPGRRHLFLVVIMLFAFMGSGMGYVWSNYEGTQIGYDLSRLQQEELRLKELNQKLRLELATFKSPQYLEAAAERLGLREAQPQQIVILP